MLPKERKYFKSQIKDQLQIVGLKKSGLFLVD
jgi:hypothetical protein